MRNKLRVEARMWACARLNPKAMSERQQISGAEGMPPLIPTEFFRGWITDERTGERR
jgi:hypothetical protein